MKIAVASDDELTIAEHFERAKGFVIVEIVNERTQGWKYREISSTGHSTRSKNIDNESDRIAQILAALKDCDIVISHRMEKRSCNDLKVAGIETYFTEEMHVATAINYYVAGILDNNTVLGCDHNNYLDG
jgi:predicted Fe-Mo cluster-binding NifX family protein